VTPTQTHATARHAKTQTMLSFAGTFSPAAGGGAVGTAHTPPRHALTPQIKGEQHSLRQ
jgi:hypothetical protein